MNILLNQRILFSAFIITFLGAAPAPAPEKAKPFGLNQRIPLTSSRVTGWPDPLPPFRTRRIFSNLTFKQPLFIVKEPTSDRLLVIERFGKIHEMTHDQSVKKTELFLDVGRETYSLCFHPRYAENGYIYTFSNSEFDGKKQNRISRYTVGKSAPHRPDPKSELVILQYQSGGHNGHFVQFGPDGMLWISAGDGTVGMDPELDGQDISNLRATMMRIDVDHPEKNRPYSIPRDNPFRNVKNARPEIWAFGFRNPYRFTFDPRNGSLWVADIGQDKWEMIYRVTRGGNYGWSIMEGPEALNATRTKGPGPIIPPVISHPHSEMRSITGGFFYRGKRYPELQGAYIYGDYDTRRLWGMKYDYKNNKVTWNEELAKTQYRILSLGEDRDGEILIVAFGGDLLTLERTPATDKPKYPFPRTLSESGLYASLKKQQYAPGVIPYSVNSPLWSDGAIKERYMAIPGTEKVGFTESRAWKFPKGTVLIKDFSLEMKQGDPNSRKKIETRFLVLHDNNEWGGYSYRWNKERTDAELVSKAGDDVVYRIQDASSQNGFREQKWHYPSRAECMVCHTREARYVLGATTLQMNRNHAYGNVTDNQLRTLNHIGLFEKPLKKQPEQLAKLPDPFDKTQPLEQRVRSYLHTNCWHCHVVNGGGNAAMELHFQKSLKDAKIFNEKPRHITFGIKDARLIAPGDPERSVILNRISRRGKNQMPPVGTAQIDQRAIQLLTDWIRGSQHDQSKSK